MTADATPSSSAGRLLIGCGMHDITGPAADRGMMGYASPFQLTAGIHMRLLSRAFVVEAESTGDRLAFVSADLCLISQAVKLAVVSRLRQIVGGRFNSANVMISATHTHSGPGGYSHHTLYNLSALGFDRQNFEAIVSGVTQSILRADANLQPGRIKMAAGELGGVTKNRSLEAYLRNPEAERALYASATDDSLTVLRLETVEGAELGVISWFAIHGTSLDDKNSLISGDNKGYASYRFERLKARPAPPAFVAAFAQSNEGDNSPNVYGGDRNGRGPDQFASMERSGLLQYEATLSLYEKAADVLPASVRVRHLFVDMSQVPVDPRRTGGLDSVHTVSASIGASMLAGTEDGRGVGWEGFSRNAVLEWTRRLITLILLLLHLKPWRLRAFMAWWRVLVRRAPGPSDDEKVRVIPTGRLQPPWTPQVLPLQLAQIGSLAIAAVPFELTTMAGRRLKRDLLANLAPAGITRVVIAGLANAYAGYVATREEYASQHYEGASTHFGPWTLAALQQSFEALSQAIVSGAEPVSAAEPETSDGGLVELRPAVLLDAAPPGLSLGTIRKDALSLHPRGQRVVVSCWAGQPNNDLHTEGTFISVERREGEDWIEVARDCHPETRFIWRRWPLAFLPFSIATAEWHPPEDAELGTYRIRIFGEGKSLLGSVRPYVGASKEFTLR
jgi:neutral ceramidase